MGSAHPMDDSGALVDLNMDEPFHSLYATWLASHQQGRQHIVSEYVGCLREQFSGTSPWGIIQKGWQSRLLNDSMDQGAIFAPILLRCANRKPCKFQNLIHLWH